MSLSEGFVRVQVVDGRPELAAQAPGQDGVSEEFADFTGGPTPILPWRRISFELCSGDVYANGGRTGCCVIGGCDF